MTNLKPSQNIDSTAFLESVSPETRGKVHVCGRILHPPDRKYCLCCLSKAWNISLSKLQPRLPYSERDLLEALPEAKKLFPTKIKELKEERKQVLKELNRKLKIIEEKSTTYSGRWLAIEWVKINELERIKELTWEIKRFERLIKLEKTKKDDPLAKLIEKALSYSIVSLVSPYTELIKAGREWKGLCPLHREKTPSFFVSPEKNFFFCHGCLKGGSTIDFIMAKLNLTFKRAVYEIAGVKP